MNISKTPYFMFVITINTTHGLNSLRWPSLQLGLSIKLNPNATLPVIKLNMSFLLVHHQLFILNFTLGFRNIHSYGETSLSRNSQIHLTRRLLTYKIKLQVSFDQLSSELLIRLKLFSVVDGIFVMNSPKHSWCFTISILIYV